MKLWENINDRILENEVWKVIEDFPDYQVSNFGRIKSFKYDKINGKILKPHKCKKYFKINLWKDGEKENIYVHRLVYETFKEKLEEGCDVHHKDENEKNNFIDNLKSKEHSKHTEEHHNGNHHSSESKNKISETLKEKFENGELNLKGENNPNFKLTNQKWIEIEVDIKKGNLTQVQIAKKHGISRETVSRIKTGKIHCFQQIGL